MMSKADKRESERSDFSEGTDADSEMTVEQFRQEAEAIQLKWRKRFLAQKKPYDYASSYLKREVYRLVRKMPDQRARAVTLLEELRKKPVRNRTEGRSVFLGLLQWIATDSELSRSEKNRYANELVYAFRHHIPAELVVGFILQVGPKKIAKRAKDKSKREDWFNEEKHTDEAFYH